MIEFYAAISRKSVKEFSGEGWHPPASRLARAGAEDAHDLDRLLEPEILNTHSVMTVIGGEVVFEDR